MPPQVANAPSMVMQGIVVPQSSVNPPEFFRRTRRVIVPARTFSFAGLGLTDNIPMLQTGILAGVSLRIFGTVVVALPTGTAASTARWPYDLIKAIRFSANGQSNLINVSGWDLKARDVMNRADTNDRGVARGVGGASPGTAVTEGTLSLNNENWGVGQNVTGIPAATYTVDLTLYVPIAMDLVNLAGAIFAQTSSTDLNLAIDWASAAELFTLTGTASATPALTVVAEPILFSIPQGPNGDVVVPDLSAFHSLIKTRNTQVSNGLNEVRLAGQGVGRQLMRLYWRVFNGAAPQAPLPLNAVNYGQVGWRYGGNDTPEIFTDGKHLAYVNERLFGSDLATLQGYGVFDWCSEFAFRDSIDEGAATELRALLEIPTGVTLTNPTLEYVQETVFSGAVGA